MAGLPARGPAVRSLGLALPPGRMPAGRPPAQALALRRRLHAGADAVRGRRPHRPAPAALVGGGPARRDMHERTTVGRGGVRIAGSRVRVRARDVEIDLELDGARGRGDRLRPRATATCGPPSRRPCRPRRRIARRARLRDRGRPRVHRRLRGLPRPPHRVEMVGRRRPQRRRPKRGLEPGHRRSTSASRSERTVWVDGAPREAAPRVRPRPLGGRRPAFTEWSAREEDANFGLMRSRYRQPFGTFAASFPAAWLAEGYGVMEEHDVAGEWMALSDKQYRAVLDLVGGRPRRPGPGRAARVVATPPCAA